MAFTVIETHGESTAASPTTSLPTGWAAGDIGFLWCGHASSSAALEAGSGGTEPSGWTKVGKMETGSDVWYLYYRILQGGDSGPSYTWSAAGNNSWTITSVNGMDSAETAPDQASVTTGANSTSHTTPSVTPSGDGYLILGFASCDMANSGHSYTMPTGWDAEVYDWEESNDFLLQTCARFLQSTAAAISGTFTPDTSRAYASGIVALKPAAAGGAMVATARGTGSVTASLLSSAAISATLLGVGSVASSLLSSASLVATCNGTGSVSATLVSPAKLVATLNGTGHVVASLTATQPDAGAMVAVARGTGSVTASLLSAAPLAATALGTGVVVTGLTSDAKFVATANGTGSVTASFTSSAPFSVAANGTGSVSASLLSDAYMAVTCNGTGSITATLTRTAAAGEMTGTCNGAGSVTASLTVTWEDDDADVTYTARVDADGATVRPARFYFAHSADGLRNADITGYDRMVQGDRHTARSNRQGRLPDLGTVFEIHMEAARAGEVWALERMIVWLSPQEENPRAADTTNRTDVDGATLRPAPWFAWLASDDERRAALQTDAASVQDRWRARFTAPTAEQWGDTFHVETETDGRAGSVWALDRLLVWASEAGDTSGRAVET